MQPLRKGDIDREVHLLPPPHAQRPAAGLRRGLPVAGAHLRRPGRPEDADRDDPAKEKSFRLQEDKGTKPNVHYIGKYSVRA